MQKKEIYLMRHGDTGLQGRYVGASDVPLSSLGVEQTKALCAHLSTVSFDAVLCSPMARCRQSIETLDAHRDVEFYDFLREIDFGLWERKTFSEIVREEGAREE